MKNTCKSKIFFIFIVPVLVLTLVVSACQASATVTPQTIAITPIASNEASPAAPAESQDASNQASSSPATTVPAESIQSASPFPATNTSVTASKSEVPGVAITPLKFYTVKNLQGAYSFKVPSDGEVLVSGPIADITWISPDLLVALINRDIPDQVVDAKTVIYSALQDELGMNPTALNLKPADEIEVSGFKTIPMTLQLNLNQSVIEGEALAIVPTEHRYFFVIAMQVHNNISFTWEKDGKVRFEQVLKSIELDLNADPLLSQTCETSADMRYGAQKDNPIRVGGGDKLGKTQMAFFINNLIDPTSGDDLESVQLDPIQAGNTTLYPWELTIKGEKKTIYLDTGKEEAPKAPFGTGCKGTLPIIEIEQP